MNSRGYRSGPIYTATDVTLIFSHSASVQPRHTRQTIAVLFESCDGRKSVTEIFRPQQPVATKLDGGYEREELAFSVRNERHTVTSLSCLGESVNHVRHGNALFYCCYHQLARTLLRRGYGVSSSSPANRKATELRPRSAAQKMKKPDTHIEEC